MVQRYDPWVEYGYDLEGDKYADPMMDPDPEGSYVEYEDYKYLYDTCLILAEALAQYASPEFYHAVGFSFDPPCGDFIRDFSEDHGDGFYKRMMPGKLAREAIATVRERHPE